MPNFQQQKKTAVLQRNKKACPIARKIKQSIETEPEKAQTLGLLDKDFKFSILSIFKVLKKTTSKEIKGTIKMLSNQIENIKKYIEAIYKTNINCGV